jgi:hypothetical protein
MVINSPSIHWIVISGQKKEKVLKKKGKNVHSGPEMQKIF